MNTFSEVSCKVLNNYLREIETKKLDVSLFLTDCEHDLDYLKNKNNRISWDCFVLLLDNLCNRLNYDYQDIRQIGKNSINAPFMKPFFAVARGLYTLPEMFYWLHGDKSNKMVTYLFSCVDISCSFDSNNNFTVNFTLEKGYKNCDAFYWSSLGLMEAIPLIYGVKALNIEMTIDDTHATYRCQVPNVGGLFSRIRRFIMAPFIMTQTTTELQNAHNELYLKNEKLIEDNRKLVETQRRLAISNVEALNASKAKSRFVAKVSHELRTPLNGILGMNQILLESGLNDVQSEYCKTIDASSETLLVLLNDLLDLGQIEAGEVKLNQTEFTLQQLLKPIESIFNLRAKSQNLEFETYIVNDYINDFVFIGDFARINQVLNNLLSNAFKYTTQGLVYFNIAYTHGQLVFNIKDSGVGISEEDQKIIFEPFKQVNPDKDGVGLGLSIVHNLLELMDGHIQIDSEVNKGTLIVITLPIEHIRNNEVIVSNTPETHKVWKKLNILLVEDNDVNQLIARKFLTTEGHHVNCVVNGLEAVEASKNNQYDLILMDINMPVMDGIEATTLIRKQFDCMQLPIIALTASASTSNIEHYKDIGMNDTLSKPLRKERLVQALRQFQIL